MAVLTLVGILLVVVFSTFSLSDWLILSPVVQPG